MTKLSWGQPGEKSYSSGLDRGVLYLPSGSGVPWSGLTSVDEDFGGDLSEPAYLMIASVISGMEHPLRLLKQRFLRLRRNLNG